MTNPFLPVINSLLSEPQASLLNGILFGTKTSLPRDFYQALIDTGTIHIIALSGMNITILVNITAKTTLFLGRKISSIATIGLIAIFVWFVGGGPTIVRAAIMGSLSLLAVYFGRRYYSLLGLFLTSIIMLSFDFSLLQNLSFQLSFLATLGIIMANKGRGEKSLLYPIKENLRVTLYAQLFTLPVILYNFRRVSLIAPLANVAIEWAIQPIMVLGFITVVAGFIWQPLGLIPAWFVWVPLTYLISVIQFLARIPGASLTF